MQSLNEDAMAARKHIPSISLDVPRLLLKYAADQGIETSNVYELAGLSATHPQQSGGRMSFARFADLWEAVVQRSADPYFGLHFGEKVLGFAGGHILLAVMMNCGTLGEALERFCRYHHLLADFTRPSLVDDGDQLIFTWKQEAVIGQNYEDTILSMLSAVLKRLTDNRLQPVEVCFAHQAPVETTEYERIFGIRPRFDQPTNRLALERGTHATPIFLANPALLMTLEQYAQQLLGHHTPSDSWRNHTSTMIRQFLLRGEKPRLRDVAHALAISPRQLQNKLQAEGDSYQGVLDSVRKQMAIDCLNRGDMTVCEIAFLVGFSEQSGFNHSFKRWVGMTPGEYTASLRS
jgi:AraC-like DNA-binding protein